ncbi:MAG: hypothetical protein ABFD18_06090 [Syntrophomonas sp.]
MLLYGERGLVNSIVLEINDNINLIRKVFDATKLGDSREFNWANDIEKVDFWIEPSFGQFGDPDLIAICNCTGNSKYLVFFEAKTVPYEDSAVSLEEKYFPGINSRINAQLTLKYRFVQALTEGGAKKGIIEETPNMLDVYKKKLHTDDKQTTRRLANSYLVSVCKNMKSDCKGFYFVALTNDRPDVNIDNFAPELTPAVLDDNGNDIWEKKKQQFGILTYTQIENILSPDGIFAATRKVVLPDLKPISPVADAQILRTINWKEFSAPTIKLRSKIQKIIADVSCEPDGEGQGIITKYEYAGSDSYKGAGGNIIIKIIPYKNQATESILLAVKDSLVSASGTSNYFDQGPYSIGVGEKARKFLGHFFNHNSNQEEFGQCRAYLADILNIN